MFNGLTKTEDQKRLEEYLAEKQVEENLKTYLTLAKKCFGDCASDFTTKKVTEKEEKCLDRCVKKFLLVSERLTKKFQAAKEVEAIFNPAQR